MPFVPVVNFWSDAHLDSLDEVQQALQGSSDKYARIIVAADDADALGRGPERSGAAVERGSAEA